MKMFYIFVGMMAARCLYYVGWKLTDSAIILSGISYDGKKDFKEIESCNVEGIELGTSPREMMDSWNHMTAVWLKHYVYEWVPKKYGKTFITFMVSAFWHGFYPTYYLFFFNAFLLTESAWVIFKNKHLFNFLPSPLWSLLANVVSLQSISLHGIAFGLLLFDKVNAYYCSMWYFHPIGCIIIILLGKTVMKG